MDTLSESMGSLNQYKSQSPPSAPAQKNNQVSSKKTTTGYTVQPLQTDALPYMPLLPSNENEKKISNFSITSHQQQSAEFTAITLNDNNADCITDLLKEIETIGIDNYLPINKLNSMTLKDYYLFIEKTLREVESIANREKGGSLSCVKKCLYGMILLSAATGASSALLGVMPLGVEATPTDRAIGITQFLLSFTFAQGVSHTNAMYNLIRKVDRQLTRCFHASTDGCGEGLSMLSGIRESISKMSWKDTVLFATALGIAFYAPMQSALNSRNGVINLITGSSQDPSLKKIGAAAGSTLMALNWTAGTSLALMMASSLFDGYKKDLETLWHGASAEQRNITKQIDMIRKRLISDHFYVDNAPLTRERLAPLADPEISESFLFALELLKSQSREDASELPPELQSLLKNLGLDTPEKQQQAITDLEKRLGAKGSRQIDSRSQLISVLTQALESPILGKTVLAKLGDDSVKYSDSTARTQAVFRLLVRITTNWLSLNCLALTLVTPGVVNHYKAYMENPAAPVDCQALQALLNSTGIEPYDEFSFELGLGAYMAKGFSLSNSAVKSLEILMIPISFMLAGCDMDNMTRAVKTMFRGFDGISTAAGLIGVFVYNWILSSAGNKYQEYLDLLECDIGVPDSPMVEEFDSVAQFTQLLMTIIFVHLYITSFKSLLRKLPLPLRPRSCDCPSAPDAKTARHDQRVTSDSESQKQKDEGEELIRQATVHPMMEAAL